MWDWVITYWVQVLFGLVATGFGLLSRKFWKMYQNEKQQVKNDDFNKCKEEIQNRVRVVEKYIGEREDVLMDKIDTVEANAKKYDQEIKKDMETLLAGLDVLKAGLLPIEGAYLIERCEHLLDKNFITDEEFKHLTQDHKAYHDLGGNSVGDQMFEIVAAKFTQQKIEQKKG